MTAPAMRGSPPRLRAFTLLEMLVVLVLLGLMVSLVGPKLVGPMDRATRQFELDVLRQDLGVLGRLARQHGQSLSLERLPSDSTKGYFDDFPAGWTIEFSPPLVVSVNGTCSDSLVTARYAGSNANEAMEVRMRIEALGCGVHADVQ